MNAPDDMFSKGGLVMFLTADADVGSGKWSHPPRVPVHFGDYPFPVYVTGDDLRCPSCGDYHDAPDGKPTKWIAANKVLNDGLCRSCDA